MITDGWRNCTDKEDQEYYYYYYYWNYSSYITGIKLLYTTNTNLVLVNPDNNGMLQSVRNFKAYWKSWNGSYLSCERNICESWKKWKLTTVSKHWKLNNCIWRQNTFRPKYQCHGKW